MQLSELTNYSHHNIYVRRLLINKSINLLKAQLRKQYLNKVIEHNPYTLLHEIKKANKILVATEKSISIVEQGIFSFDI